MLVKWEENGQKMVVIQGRWITDEESRTFLFWERNMRELSQPNTAPEKDWCEVVGPYIGMGTSSYDFLNPMLEIPTDISHNEDMMT